MYCPSHFTETRLEVLHALIRQHPLGTLVTHGTAGLDADHLPFTLDAGTGPNGRLVAHVARANPLWQQASDSTPVMVIFHAEDGYISPNWYPSKHETHQQVPTWNYAVVHAHGRIVIHDDMRFVRGVVGKLTRTHEAAEPRPWKMSDSSPDFIDGRLEKVVGIEILIDTLQGKMKLSQNRSARDREAAALELAQRGHTTLAERMNDSEG